MNFAQLKSAFINKSIAIEQTGEPTAKYRSINYRKVANIINKETKSQDIATYKKIDELPITAHMKEKAKEFMNTSHNLESQKTKGIGASRAKILALAGVKNTNDLANKKYRSLLSKETVAYLDLKPADKIPHDYIKKFEAIIKKLSCKSLKLLIVGSYRRKKAFSSDVDIMIVSNKENAIEIFKNKIQALFESRVYAQGPNKLSMIIIADITFKIDAFKTTPEEEIPMLLYSTGSKDFNIYMRGTAKKQGYLLNQKGLYKAGSLISGLKKEEDYFDILGIPYIKPENR